MTRQTPQQPLIGMVFTNADPRYAGRFDDKQGGDREVMLFIAKKPRGRIMISNASNHLKDSRKESLLRWASCTSICVWLVCDLVVMCGQAVGDRTLGDLCVCVRCGSVQSQKV